MFCQIIHKCVSCDVTTEICVAYDENLPLFIFFYRVFDKSALTAGNTDLVVAETRLITSNVREVSLSEAVSLFLFLSFTLPPLCDEETSMKIQQGAEGETHREFH